jgi:hypothetical protein
MKNKILYAILSLIFSGFLVSCAYVTAEKLPITAFDKEGNPYDMEGFPYYMKKPLLVVSNDTVRVIWIDDHTNLWGVKIGAILAKNKTKLEFGREGGLTKVDADLEDDAVALKFLDVVNSTLQDAMKAGLLGGEVRSGQTGKFQIFDMVYDEKTGAFKELRPLISQDVFKNKMLDIPTMKAVSETNVVPGEESLDNEDKPDPTPPDFAPH